MVASSSILAYLMLLAPLASLGQGYISLDIPVVRCSLVHDAWLSYDRTNQEPPVFPALTYQSVLTKSEHTAQRLARSMPWLRLW